MTLDPLAGLDPSQRAMVDRAHERVWALFPEQAKTWGEEGRKRAHEDMAFHFMFLRDGMELGGGVFTDYVCWARDVLVARNVPEGALRTALQILAKEYSPGEKMIVAAIAALDRHTPPEPPPMTPLARLLLDGDARMAAQLFDPITDAASHQAASALAMEAMFAIGDAWARGEINAGQEHLASHALKSVLVHLGAQIPYRIGHGRVVLSCVPGNQHDLGLAAVADQCRAAGWDVRLLGADVPAAALLACLQIWNPELVFLSAALPEHVRTAKDLVERIRRASSARIYIGGTVFRGRGDLWRLTGADGHGVFASDVLPKIGPALNAPS